jgi:magnesium transporter
LLSTPVVPLIVSSLYQVVGIILAVTSGLLIGSSFVFKKKGLLRSQAGQTAGKGVAYLKSVCP